MFFKQSTDTTAVVANENKACCSKPVLLHLEVLFRGSSALQFFFKEDLTLLWPGEDLKQVNPDK